MKYFLFIALAVVFTVNAYGQTKEEEARVLYQKAEDAYDNTAIDNTNYKLAYDYLSRVEGLIGINPKTLYLKIKVITKGINSGAYSKNEGNYKLGLNLITQLFSIIDKATYPPEKYTEMIGLKIDIADKLKPFQDAKAQARLYYEDIKSKKADFLKNVFDVQIQKLVKNFNDNNAAIFDPSAFTTSSQEYLENCRKFIKKKPESGPFTHHLEYNPATREIYIYRYVPGDNKAITADTVNALELNSYTSRSTIYFDGFNKVNNQPKKPVINLRYRPAGEKTSKDDLWFRIDDKIIDDLFLIMRDKIFEACYKPVFAFNDNGGMHYIKNISNGWAEFAYPSQSPIFNYEELTYQGSKTEMFLYDTNKNLFLKLSDSECLTGKISDGPNWKNIGGNTLSKSLHDNVTNKAHTGAWMTEMDISDSESSK